jgi:hypothetical protein
MPPPTRPRDDRPFDPAELSRVFTVQLRDRDGSSGAPGLAGRLTHAATGQASHFDSADELVALLVGESDRLRKASEAPPQTGERVAPPR